MSSTDSARPDPADLPPAPAFVMTRMGQPATHFAMQPPSELEGHFNNLQTTVNYDQLELVFNALTNGMPREWQFSIQYLDADRVFQKHFFQVNYRPDKDWDERLTANELTDKAILKPTVVK